MHKQLKGIGIKHIKPKGFQEKQQKTNRKQRHALKSCKMNLTKL